MIGSSGRSHNMVLCHLASSTKSRKNPIFMHICGFVVSRVVSLKHHWPAGNSAGNDGTI
jgi:hypothetical protein